MIENKTKFYFKNLNFSVNLRYYILIYIIINLYPLSLNNHKTFNTEDSNLEKKLFTSF